MRDLLDAQRKLYPDLLAVMQQRYTVLKDIELLQPIGRRGLAVSVNLTERNVRGEVEFLQNQGLIDVTSKGMHVTNEGKLVIEQLTAFMYEVSGSSVLEKQLKDKLQIGSIIIVSGNSDTDNWVKQEMGKACAVLLQKRIEPAQTIAVTGGTTIAAVAEAMKPFENAKTCLFVPARGGIGEKEENQANTIAAKMARQANGEYRLLYVPDPLSETSYQTMIKEPTVKEIQHIIKDTDVVLHGIGDAMAMAKRRKTSETVMKELEIKKAVSEAFGYYFDESGKVVHKVRTIGLHLDDLSAGKLVVTVAGGKSKAQAIASYFKHGKSDLLITDKAAAEQILEG